MVRRSRGTGAAPRKVRSPSPRNSSRSANNKTPDREVEEMGEVAQHQKQQQHGAAKQLQKPKAEARKGRGKSPGKNKKSLGNSSRASSRGRRRSRSRARRSKSADAGEGGSVGSTLSTQDQFDIILPIDPVKMDMRREVAMQDRRADDDAVSSLTTDEYRKYGGLYWRLKTGTCSDCCLAPISCNKTTTTVAMDDEVTVPPLHLQHQGEEEEEHEKHVNFEDEAEMEHVMRGKQAQTAQQGTEQGGFRAIFCGGSSFNVQDETTMVRRRSRSPRRTRSPSRSRSPRKSDQSVDRSASLFDDAFTEADERENEANRGGRVVRSWKFPWRKRNQKAPVVDTNDLDADADFALRPESRQGHESLATSTASRQGRDTPVTVASASSKRSRMKRNGTRGGGAESPAWHGGRDTPNTVTSNVSRRSIMKRRGSRSAGGAESPALHYPENNARQQGISIRVEQ